MKRWDEVADDATIAKTAAALEKNGIKALVVENGAAAKAKVLEIIPAGEQVMNMTSVTLTSIGVVDEILKSGKYDAVRNRLAGLDKAKDEDFYEAQRLGAAPHWAIGSVHAVTQDGKLLIASNTGSQLPAYGYGASYVIWVVGAQKIVADFNEGLQRIYEYVLPLESERANKAYKITTGSNVSKLLVINKEVWPDRLTVILVKEKLGF